MENELQNWRPDWSIHPGEIVQEALEERGLTQSDLARRMGRPTKTINEIVHGKAAITPDTAIQLELALGISSAFWNRLEVDFREHLAAERAQHRWESATSWAKAFPVSEMRDRDLVEGNDASLVASMLSYFRVASPEAWEAEWSRPSVAFRSQEKFDLSRFALAAWLVLGEREASSIECAPFNSDALRDALETVRPLTRKDPIEAAIARATVALAGAGVALVVVPAFKKVPVSGTARWVSKTKAIIQLSLRFKTDDQFWFSLFHEGGHLYNSRGEAFLDAVDLKLTDDAEREANEFARDLLVPTSRYSEFVRQSDFSAGSVRSFAQGLSIAPGIVVGMLQHDGLVPMEKLNFLKHKVTFA